MQNATSEIGLDVEQEYRAIEAALLDNPRGRWFLAEHGRRSRRLDSVLRCISSIGRERRSGMPLG